MLLNNDLTHQRILHHDACEFADICRRRLVVLVRESVRIRIVGGLEAERTGIPVHFLKEVLHWLIGLHASLVLGIDAADLASDATDVGAGVVGAAGYGSSCVVVQGRCVWCLVLGTCLAILVASCNFEKVLTEVLGESDSSIVTTGKHKTVQEVPHAEHVARAQLS